MIGHLDIKGPRYCWACELEIDPDELIDGIQCPYCFNYPKKKEE